MMKNIVDEILKRFPGAFRQATDHDIDQLRVLGLSEIVLNHYKDYEPCDVSIFGVQNHSISSIYQKNDNNNLSDIECHLYYDDGTKISLNFLNLD